MLHAKESGANVPFSSELSHQVDRRLSRLNRRSRRTKSPDAEVFESRRIRIPAGTRMFLVKNPLRQKVAFVKFPCRISCCSFCQVGLPGHTRRSQSLAPLLHAHPKSKYPAANASLQYHVSVATSKPKIAKAVKKRAS